MITRTEHNIELGNRQRIVFPGASEFDGFRPFFRCLRLQPKTFPDPPLLEIENLHASVSPLTPFSFSLFKDNQREIKESSTILYVEKKEQHR